MSDPTKSVKKHFQPILNLLLSNQSKVVSALLPQLQALMVSTTRGGHAFYDVVTGKLVVYFCYYHKKFELVGTGDGQAEYGQKNNTPTGVNTMCKIGAAAFGVRNAAYKTGRETTMLKMMEEPPALTIEQARPILKSLEAGKDTIIPREDNLGFDSLDEATAAYGQSLTPEKPKNIAPQEDTATATTTDINDLSGQDVDVVEPTNPQDVEL